MPTLDRIIGEISAAEKEGPRDLTIRESCPGLSGNKIIGLLQRLASVFENDETACYLEVGIFRGLTFLSAAISSPNLACFGVDNFSYFDPEKENLNFVESNIAKHGLKNVHIINSDYEDAFMDLESYMGGKKIAVYFVDGPHDYRSQLMCLDLALPYFHENVAIVVDDCNYRHVRQANRDFLINNPAWKLVFEAYTPCHPLNMTDRMLDQAKEEWWNGVNVLVHDTVDALVPMYPPTHRSRQLYENENIVHGDRFAELVPLFHDFFQLIFRFRLFKATKLFARVMLEYARNRDDFSDRFDRMNTFSADLPKSQYAQHRKVD